MLKIDMFKPGDIHNRHFKIIKKIAEGGQAVTYLVLDTLQKKKQKKNVLKVAEIKLNNKQNIKAEYKLIKSFDHPNIVKAYQSYDKQIKGILYFFIIMEYIEGGELKDFLGKLKEEQIQNIYHQLKSAIQYIHTKRVIHRDLTLANILLDNKKNIRMIDFGIATQLDQKTHVETQFLQGSRIYKPKQLIQQQIVTKQNDLWQFGITLIQLVTGIEISQLTNKKIACFVENFPQQVFVKYKVSNKFRSMISPLLRKSYKERKFYEDIFFNQLSKSKSEIQIGNNKKGIKIKSRQTTKLSQSFVYQTILKLTRITDIQLKTSIKQQHIQHLLQLVCPDCFLNDESGNTIRSLNKLQKLDMSNNNLTDLFTCNIESLLPQLTTLKLAFTNIRDDSISLITKKSILQQLDISYSFVSQAGITKLSKLDKLSSLAIWSGQYYYPQRYENFINLGGNQGKYQNNKIKINQQCIKQLCKLKLTEICMNADKLDIDELIFEMSKQSTCVEVRGKISNKTVEYICDMEKLEHVYLKDIEKIEIKEFRSKVLKSCTLINCKIDENQLIKSLSNCNQMKNLNLGDNKIGNQGVIKIVKNMMNLTSLNLGWNNIDDQGVIEIANNMKNLTCLNLWYNSISKSGVTKITKQMKNLTILDLWYNNIGNQGAIQIAKNMNSLISLNLGHNNISNQGVIEIAKNMKNLISLSLRNNNINEQGVIVIANNMKNLISLDLCMNKIGNQGVIQIAKNMKSLTSLNLNDNKIGNQGVVEISKSMMGLIYLNLGVNKISKQGAKQISNNLLNLTSLDLCNNNIGKQGALELANNMRNLSCLNLKNNNIDHKTEQLMKQLLPNTWLMI